MTLHAYNPLGDSPNNLVINEEHDTADSTARCIIADSGLFFTESMFVKRKSNNAPLVLGTDYEFFGFDAEETFLTGSETACSIVLKNDAISGVLVLQYQAVGGVDAEKSALVEDLRRRLLNFESGTITWAEILEKPSTYPPGPHPHDILTDLQNVSTLSVFANRIVEALTSSRVPVLSGVNLHNRIERCFYLMAVLRNEFSTLAMSLRTPETYIAQLTAASFTPVDEHTYFSNWVLTTPILKASKFFYWDTATDKLVATALGFYKVETTITVQFPDALAGRFEIGKLQIDDTINHPSATCSDYNYTTQAADDADSIVTFKFLNYIHVTDLETQNNLLRFSMVNRHPPYAAGSLTAVIVASKL